MEMCTKRFKIDRVNAPAICFTTLVIYSQAVTHIAHMLLTVISIIPKYICILCMTLAKSLINKKTPLQYIQHWVLRLASVIGVEVAKPNSGR